MMMPGWGHWLLLELPLFIVTAVCAHLVVSFTQTASHRWLGHRRLGGFMYRKHVSFHHAYYTKGHLASSAYRGEEGNITPFFLIPFTLLGGGLYFVLPFPLFLVMMLATAASFYAHVFFDKEYHVAGSPLERRAAHQNPYFLYAAQLADNLAVDPWNGRETARPIVAIVRPCNPGEIGREHV